MTTKAEGPESRSPGIEWVKPVDNPVEKNRELRRQRKTQRADDADVDSEHATKRRATNQHVEQIRYEQELPAEIEPEEANPYGQEIHDEQFYDEQLYFESDFQEVNYSVDCGSNVCGSGVCGIEPGCGMIGCGTACSSCSGTPSMAWGHVEYLVWWIDGFDAPPLVTTSPANVDRDVAGVLGQPGTTVLVGGEDLTDSPRSMGRITFGEWFDSCESLGIQGSYFGLAQEDFTYSSESPGDPIRARPFNNVEPGFEGQDSELVAFPGLLSGNIRVHAESRLQGAEVLLRKQLFQRCGRRLDLVAGWKYTDLEEDLQINDFRTVLSGNTGLAVGTTLEEYDRFQTENVFNGAQLGFIGRQSGCLWFFEYGAKVALGSTNSKLRVDGQTTTSTPVPGGAAQVNVTPAGLLAQQTNIGSFEQDDFTVVPEFSFTLGRKIGCRTHITAGYTFLYWSRVVRPGDQIDVDLNLSQLAPGGLVGAALPEQLWNINDLTVQGLSFGLHHRF